jgi:L-glyceraldehyde 3-phosphate reductase
MGALDHAVKSGKALYAGLSNYDGARMKEACAILRELRCPFVINQNRYSILDRKIEYNGLLTAALEEKKGVIVYSPLAQGLLTDRYLYGIPEDSRVRTSGLFLKESAITEERIARASALNKIALERGETLAKMALSWVLAKEGVTSVLVGASKPEQIRENASACRFTPFTDEELRLIDEIALN